MGLSFYLKIIFIMIQKLLLKFQIYQYSRRQRIIKANAEWRIFMNSIVPNKPRK